MCCTNVVFPRCKGIILYSIKQKYRVYFVFFKKKSCTFAPEKVQYPDIQMTELYLVRHGETVDNALQIMQGQTQGMLNEQGIEQARNVAEQMKDWKVDAFVSSDLHRAIQTAEIIAQPHGKKIETTTLLRERDWGGFTGMFIPDLKDKPWPDDVESQDALLKRASDFLNYIKTNYNDKTVVAVGHGIINKAIQAVYHHCTMRDIARMANAEIRILKL